jgi:isopentenyl-diphosphate Delta-isomerase
MSKNKNTNQVILVNKYDQPIGSAEKITAHQENLCHRAFSVILTRIKNQQTEILLQKRQSSKYHCANLWSNACCSHPAPNTNTLESAIIRLKFEMNITCQLTKIGALYYQTKLSNDLFEHEYDHIFQGFYPNDSCDFNPEEVSAVKWLPLASLKETINQNPEQFTPWLALILTKKTILNQLLKKSKSS